MDSGSADTQAAPLSSAAPMALAAVDPGYYVERCELARGGMGQIIAARDLRLDRRVAIKELRVQSPELRARFEREVLLTARLQHPSIVNIHEAGRWPSGEPFYAMKLVAGRALDETVATAQNLSQRIALLPHVLAVADALAYAHQQRVIHRDLKPNNVLVGEFGETVVIDWGLAKDLQRTEDSVRRAALASEPDETCDGDVLGTPAYMPPEQALGETVDERADVYAIGALLYFVLAGVAPYSGTTTLEVLDAVLHGAPIPLDQREPGVAPDLLAIVRRAMARNAADRYPTARELAEDLRRFQAGQLVGAHHYSLSQLIRRWFSRHRTPIAVAAVALLALIVIGIASVAKIVRAERRATAQQVLAETSRAEAEQHRDFMLGDLRAKLEAVGKLQLLGDVAAEMKAYYARRPATRDPLERRQRAQAAHNLGDVLRERGDLAGAMREYHAGLAIRAALSAELTGSVDHRALADSHNRVGDVRVEQGNFAGALSAYQSAVAITRGLAAGDPANTTWTRDLALGHQKVGDVLLEQGAVAAALFEYEAGRDRLLPLVAREPENTGWLRGLSVMHENVSDALRAQGNLEPALVQQRAALAIAEKLVAREPENAVYLRDLAICHSKLGNLHRASNALDEALARYRTALGMSAALAERDPSNADWQRGVGIMRRKVGDVLLATGDRAGAVASYREALRIAEQLVARDGNNASWKKDLAGIRTDLSAIKD